MATSSFFAKLKFGKKNSETTPECPLLALPFDFWQDVLFILHNEDYPAFLALRSTSRMLRHQSEAAMFRNIKLSGDSDDRVESHIIDRLNDPEDHLAVRVRNIFIHARSTNWLDDLANSIEANRFPSLQILQWRSVPDLAMPDRLYEAVQTQPHIRLSVLFVCFSEQDSSSTHTLSLGALKENVSDFLTGGWKRILGVPRAA